MILLSIVGVTLATATWFMVDKPREYTVTFSDMLASGMMFLLLIVLWVDLLALFILEGVD